MESGITTFGGEKKEVFHLGPEDDSLLPKLEFQDLLRMETAHMKGVTSPLGGSSQLVSG